MNLVHDRQRMAAKQLEEEAELEKLKKEMQESEKKLENDKLLLTRCKNVHRKNLDELKLTKEKKSESEKQLRKTESEFSKKLQGIEKSEHHLQTQFNVQKDQLQRDSKVQEKFQKELKTSSEKLKSSKAHSESLQGQIASEYYNIKELSDEEKKGQKEQIQIKNKIIDSNWEMKNISTNIEKHSAEIEKKRREIEKLELRCAWKKFEVELNNWTPNYELVKEGRKNKIFNLSSSKLIDHFNFLESSHNSWLKKYSELNSSDFLQSTRAILSSMVETPTWEKFSRGSIGAWTGRCICLSSISHYSYSEDEIQVKADKVIYIDCNWKLSGKNIIFCAPNIIAIKKPLIDTSGLSAKEFSKTKASNGSHKGQSGSDGRDGDAGESAGNIAITCEVLSGKLRIKANGGDGANGQDGGDGMAGRSGEDGNSYPVSSSAPDEPNRLLDRFTVKVENKGSSGTPGIAGGCGGNAGAGNK